MNSLLRPKVFISYSWTSEAHQRQIADWAERLIGDGVEVVLDLFDLKEGQDKYRFMERMVNDETISNVLIFSESRYAQKADDRQSGVGTESQIISQKVYEEVGQSKFIPLVCEFDEAGQPCLPTFLMSRIWIDFSTPEAANSNWERMIRILYDKPVWERPKLGSPPLYITEATTPVPSPATAKFDVLRKALDGGLPSVAKCRRIFLDAASEFYGLLKDRDRPNAADDGQRVLEDFSRLVRFRDHIIDWVLLEGETVQSDDFSHALVETFERLLELQLLHSSVTDWRKSWKEAVGLNLHEVFLYTIAALLKTRRFRIIHDLFSSNYILPETMRDRPTPFARFGEFYKDCRYLNSALTSHGRTLCAPTGALFRKHAQRPDLSTLNIVEADLLTFFAALLDPLVRWYPSAVVNEANVKTPAFFLKATQRKHFTDLATVLGVSSADELRAAFKVGYNRLNVADWHVYGLDRNYANLLNLDKLDTIP